jgi:flagellar motor switch protein FliM
MDSQMDSRDNARGPQPVHSPSEYEACDPGALPSGQLAYVRTIQEKFLGAFAANLADRLETPVSGKLTAVQPISRSAFLQSVEDGGCLVTLSAEPVRGQALIALSPGLVAYLLRILLGAPPSSGSEYRTVTEIELYILQEIFESFAIELTNAWKATGIAFRRASTGARETAGWQGTMLAFECRLDFDDAQETFCVAAPAFLGRLAALQLTTVVAEESPAPVREMILRALRGARVNVEAVLTGSTLRMGDLLAMEPGHILMLTQPVGSPVECRIGGKPKFRGEWIDHDNSQALLLV